MEDRPRSYVLCSVPRCGSTLLARALAGLGAGAPDEFFNPARPVDGHGLAERPGPANCRTEDDWRAYLEELQDRFTVGGVFGLKAHYSQLAGHPGLRAHLPALLPGARYVALRRRDRLRQAISAVRAGQTQQWASTLPAVREPWFDRVAIDAARAEIAAEGRGWEGFFRAHGIRPYRMVYEDLARDYASTVAAVARFVGGGVGPVPPPPLERQADNLTEEWVRRYRAGRRG
jgi:LPS sulfotransferase NodH